MSHQHTDLLRVHKMLLDVSNAMTAQLDTGALLSLVVHSAVDLLAGNAGLIALRDESATLRIHAAAHIPQEQWSAFDYLVDMYQDSEFQCSDQNLQELRLLTEVPLRQVIALPMTYHGTSVGIMLVFRAAVNVAFSHEDQRILAAFANQAAIAVTNARLFQTLAREKQHLAAIVEQSMDGVMILDSRWRITAFNRAMELLTGWERDAANGRPCAEVVGITTSSGDNLCQIDCPLQRERVGNIVQAEGWILARDGRRRYIQNTYTVQRDAAGHFAGAIVNVREITQQKIESEMQNTFISVISHELKTPVSIIKGYAEMLARPDVRWQPEQVQSSLQIIIEEADRLTAEINNLLDVSRMQLSAMQLELTHWPLRPLIDNVCVRFATQAERAHVTFEVRVIDEIPEVLADRERTRLVCENLITNAIKYSPEGGTIRIQIRRENGMAIVSVSDQGIGIPSEEQSKIFDRFYRVDNRISRNTQGFGLGLFLAKAIVEAQKGQIWVESRANQGTRFSFSVPLATSQITGDITPDEPVVIDLGREDKLYD
jgi:PAS domain S-box-containing protein